MAKKKQDFKSPFIPISELGMSEEGWLVNVEEMNNALYESYCACCQSSEAATCPSSESDYGKDRALTSHDMATTGRAGQFIWVALTSLYDETLHQMDEFKAMHNKHHLEAACDILESPSNNLQHAINNDHELVNICRNVVVVNITEYRNYYENNWHNYRNFLNYLHHMGNFFGCGLTSEVFMHIEKKDGSKVVRINPNLIKGKDVVIPQIIASQFTLELFKRVAAFICKNGANSVIGVFITRVKPTVDGREPQSINEKYTLQPLGPRFFGGLGIPCF